MDNPMSMRLVQRIGDLDGDFQSLLEGKRLSFQPFHDRLTLDEFHHEKIDLLRVADVIQRADMWMIQRGDRLGLAVEPGLRVRV